MADTEKLQKNHRKCTQHNIAEETTYMPSVSNTAYLYSSKKYLRSMLVETSLVHAIVVNGKLPWMDARISPNSNHANLRENSKLISLISMKVKLTMLFNAER